MSFQQEVGHLYARQLTIPKTWRTLKKALGYSFSSIAVLCFCKTLFFARCMLDGGSLLPGQTVWRASSILRLHIYK